MSRVGIQTFIGSRLKQTRKKLGLTQAELGEKIGVSGWSIQQWETGGRRPQAQKFRLIIEALNIDPEWLAPLPADATLTQIRQHRGLTQETLSERIGLTSGQITSIENGRQHPPDAAIVAEVWGLTIEDFWEAWERSRLQPPKIN